MRGVPIPDLEKREYHIIKRNLDDIARWGQRADGAYKKRQPNKKQRPPTKNSEDGLDISEYESVSDFLD